MRAVLLAAFALIAATAAQAGEWRLQRIDAPARVTAIDTVDGKVRVQAGHQPAA